MISKENIFEVLTILNRVYRIVHPPLLILQGGAEATCRCVQVHDLHQDSLQQQGGLQNQHEVWHLNIYNYNCGTCAFI